MINLLTIYFFLFLCSASFAQTNSDNPVKEFKLSIPKSKIQNSLYNSIKLIDLRNDTTDMGFIEEEGLSDKTRMISKIPLSYQLSLLISVTTDQSAKDDELYLLLRRFSFYGVSDALRQDSYCSVIADLFVKDNDEFKRVCGIDSTIHERSSGKVLKKGSLILSDMILNSYLKEPQENKLYRYHDILQLDSVEKKDIKVFNTSTFTDGVYSTYKLFMNQTPDQPVVSFVNKKGIISVVGRNKLGKLGINGKNAFAVVYNNMPYIVTENGIFELTKDGNEWTFIAKSKTSIDPGLAFAFLLLGGITGGIASSFINTSTMYQFKINYHNGKFIPIKALSTK